MKAAIYARYSTDNQREESLDDQFRACGRVASSQGLDVVERFSDAGISGGTTERPGYQALLAAARRKSFDIIIVEDISRLWRSRSEYGQRSAEFEDLGVHMVSAVGDDTRRDGWGLVLGIKQAIAEHYRREVSYRTRRGLEGVALAGGSTGGRCYGYQPGEADVVRGIYEARRVGRSVTEISHDLNARGIPGPRGPRWSYNAVKRILANERFSGRLSWGRSTVHTLAASGRRGRPQARPEGPLVVREIPALVDPSVWASAQTVT